MSQTHTFYIQYIHTMHDMYSTCILHYVWVHHVKMCWSNVARKLYTSCMCCAHSVTWRLYNACLLPCFTAALDQTHQVRRWTLARGEVLACSLLPQLWPAVPSTADYWRKGQTGQATIRCLDSWYRKREMEEGETDNNIVHSLQCFMYILSRWSVQCACT